MALIKGTLVGLAAFATVLALGCSDDVDESATSADLAVLNAEYVTALCGAIGTLRDAPSDVERLVQDAFGGDAEAMRALGLDDDPNESTGQRVARIRAAEARLTGRLSDFVIDLETIEPSPGLRDFHEAQVDYYRELANHMESPDFDPSAQAPAAPTPSSEVEALLRDAIESVPECSILGVSATLDSEPEQVN